jgi:hypothetical protein
MTRPIAALLRWVALIGTLGGIATLEYLAGRPPAGLTCDPQASPSASTPS